MYSLLKIFTAICVVLGVGMYLLSFRFQMTGSGSIPWFRQYAGYTAQLGFLLLFLLPFAKQKLQGENIQQAKTKIPWTGLVVAISGLVLALLTANSSLENVPATIVGVVVFSIGIILVRRQLTK